MYSEHIKTMCMCIYIHTYVYILYVVLLGHLSMTIIRSFLKAFQTQKEENWYM